MKKDLARDYAKFVLEIREYLEMKLDGYRRVDKLPEDHAIVQTALRFQARAVALLAATPDKIRYPQSR